MQEQVRFSANAGIAIGPILFVLALLGIIATVMATSSGTYSSAAVADRVASDIVNQANLIRGKINECNLRCLNNKALDQDSAGGLPCPNESWPDSVTSGANVASGTPVAVANLRCPATLDGSDYGNLWLYPEPTQLAPMTSGFENNPWQYVNAGESGGRCFWTKPNTGNNNSGIVEALQRLKEKKFTAYNVSTKQGELNYNPADPDQKFVIIITPPTGTLDSNCAVP
jgi:type II secretory pathway pseudopilin PulG